MTWDNIHPGRFLRVAAIEEVAAAATVSSLSGCSLGGRAGEGDQDRFMTFM